MGNQTTHRRSQHPVSLRHFRQIVRRSRDLTKTMTPLVGLTWRPGDKTGSFLGKTFRPLGSPLLVVQHSELINDRGRMREKINLLGYKTEIDPENGVVYFGGADRNVFAYDFGLRPHAGARGRILDPERNPSLGYLALEMDKVRQNYAERSYKTRSVPTLPRIYLGFSTDNLPPVEDSPMLRNRVARHMRKRFEEVEAMSADMVRPLLEAEWPSCFIPPGEQGNSSKLHLINAEMCSGAPQAFRIFECFDELLGAEIYNPARELISPKNVIKNPTLQVVERTKIDWKQAVHGQGDDDDALGEKLVKAVRESLGAVSHLCSQEDLDTMVLFPEQDIVPSGLNDLKNQPERIIIELMRQQVGRHSEACTDAALLEASHNPTRPLFAAGLCCINVVRVDEIHKPHCLAFGPEQLARQKTHVALHGVKPFWSKRDKKNGRSKPVAT